MISFRAVIAESPHPAKRAKKLYYHYTTKENKAQILQSGFRVSDEGEQQWGKGVYFTSNTDGAPEKIGFFGDKEGQIGDGSAIAWSGRGLKLFPINAKGEAYSDSYTPLLLKAYHAPECKETFQQMVRESVIQTNEFASDANFSDYTIYSSLDKHKHWLGGTKMFFKYAPFLASELGYDGLKVTNTKLYGTLLVVYDVAKLNAILEKSR